MSSYTSYSKVLVQDIILKIIPSLLQGAVRACKSLPFEAVAGEEFSLVAAIAGRCEFQQSLRSDITGSGHLHHLRRVFSLSVKLLLTLKEPQDASIMEAVLDVMGFGGYRDAAEWLMNTLERPPELCYNCREYRKWRFVGEGMDPALCAGCLVCAHRRDCVRVSRVCSEREVGKEIQHVFQSFVLKFLEFFSFLEFFTISQPHFMRLFH